MKSEILSYLAKHINYYSNWHEGDVISDTEAYFRTGQFTQAIVDLVIEVAPYALNINLFIYQKGNNGNLSVKEYYQSATKPDIHVHFMYHKDCDLANHYEPIVKYASTNPEFFTGFVPPSPESQDSPCTTPRSSPFSQQLPNEEYFQKCLGTYKFPTQLFQGMEPTVVDYLPGDIDGLKLYKIKVKTKNIWVHAADLRYFKMNTSARHALTGKRKVGYCMGSYTCTNFKCPFLNTNKMSKRNSSQFFNLDGKKACKHCGLWAKNTLCPARKMAEYDSVSQMLTVYHVGTQTCTPKPNVGKYDKLMTDALAENLSIGPVGVKRLKVGEHIWKGDIEAGKQKAMEFNTNRMKFLKNRLVRDLNPDQHSFEAVGIYKEQTDKSDPFLIYKVNDGRLNDQPDFVFKSSTESLQLAIEMDQDGPPNDLQDQEAFFDGAHKRCVGFKTLGLFLLHPGMRRILRLASMEVRAESQIDIALFWKTLNEAISKLLDKENVIFNPKAIMVDENGANFCGVKEAFGLDYCLSKVVSCQLHFKKDLLRQVSKIGESFREEFYKIGMQLCQAATVAEYNTLKSLLDEYGKQFPAIQPWIDWWDARKYHVFPCFRGFGYTGVTLAESGQSSTKRKTALWLLEAAKDDTTTMVIQNTDLKKYNQQVEDVIGIKAPNQVTKASNARREQIKIAKAYVAEMQNPSQFEEHLQEVNTPGIFMPAKNAKHRVGKRGGVQGKLITKSPRGRASKRGRGRGRGVSRNAPNTSSLADIMRRGEEILAASTAGPECPQSTHRGAYNPKDNPPTVCLFLGLNVSRCQGCFGIIDKNVLTPPRDMALRIRDYRSYLDPKGHQKERYGNIYFHLKFDCLKRKYAAANINDLVVADDTLSLLSDAHLQHLKEVGFLEAILLNKRKEMGEQ